MVRRVSSVMVATALVVVALAPGAARGEERRPLTDGVVVEVAPGESLVFDVPGLKRLSITQPKTADVVMLGPGEFRLDGVSPGRTTLYAWNGEVRLRCDVVVTKRVSTWSGYVVRLATVDGAVGLSIPVGRVGWLAGDVEMTYLSPSTGTARTVKLAKDRITGFFNARGRLLIHVATLVDPAESILEVDFDHASRTGKLTLRLTPAATSSWPELAVDGGKVALVGRPLVVPDTGVK